MNKYGLKAVIFDLDGTLAESKMPLSEDMAIALRKLLNHYSVAVMSGASFSQFETQFLAKLHRESNLENLYILPTSGTELKVYRRREWHSVYKISLDDHEKTKILESLEKMSATFGINNEKVFGKRIEDRVSQITFSALGQNAPIDEKQNWDPKHEKREKMKSFLNELIPEFDINIGGATSIDITKKGFDKAMGITEFCRYTGIPVKEIIYVGDALFPGGNDSTVLKTGVRTRQVNNIGETLNLINDFIQNA